MTERVWQFSCDSVGCQAKYRNSPNAAISWMWNGGLMAASWALKCPECKMDFTYAEVPPDNGVFAWSSEKPEFPDCGLRISCRHCGTFAHHYRTQLFYQMVKRAVA